MTDSTPPACLICSEKQVSIASSLTGAQLRLLWASLDNEIGDYAYGSITPETQVNLYRCESCGFRFYNPKFSGSAEFYEELMAKKIYPLGSPEFAHAIDFAARYNIKRVLDVGGGEGAFLDMASKAGLETSGVELNRHAAQVAAGKGHRMFNKPMEHISTEELDGGAEFLTLFQVIEHVPAPVDFVIDAARLLKPGGYISIAVPSDRRVLGLLDKDPADWPPHHVSRWRISDLRKLGERSGLEFVENQTNQLFGQAISWAFDLHNQLETALGGKPLGIPRSLISLATFVYRVARMQNHLPFHGLSIRAVFKKPCP